MLYSLCNHGMRCPSHLLHSHLLHSHNACLPCRPPCTQATMYAPTCLMQEQRLAQVKINQSITMYAVTGALTLSLASASFSRCKLSSSSLTCLATASFCTAFILFDSSDTLLANSLYSLHWCTAAVSNGMQMSQPKPFSALPSSYLALLIHCWQTHYTPCRKKRKFDTCQQL